MVEVGGGKGDAGATWPRSSASVTTSSQRGLPCTDTTGPGASSGVFVSWKNAMAPTIAATQTITDAAEASQSHGLASVSSRAGPAAAWLDAGSSSDGS